MCGKEDFGIAPIEAMAAGLPIFGLAEGGLLETVVPGMTGHYFHESTTDAFLAEFERFHSLIESNHFHPESIRQHAQAFSRERFLASFDQIVNE